MREVSREVCARGFATGLCERFRERFVREVSREVCARGFARGPTAIKLEACEGCEVVSNAYNVVCELTSRHTAASSGR